LIFFHSWRLRYGVLVLAHRLLDIKHLSSFDYDTILSLIFFMI
jgi:hypothetical protein